jgi:hypothetical protein
MLWAVTFNYPDFFVIVTARNEEGARAVARTALESLWKREQASGTDWTTTDAELRTVLSLLDGEDGHVAYEQYRAFRPEDDPWFDDGTG